MTETDTETLLRRALQDAVPAPPRRPALLAGVRRRVRARRRRRTAAAASTAVMLAGGLALAWPHPATTPETLSVAPSSAAPTSSTHPPGRALRVVGQEQYMVPEQQVEHLALWSHYLGFASAGPSGVRAQMSDRVEVIDRTTGVRRTVARSVWPAGQMDWVQGTGDWVVFTDQSQQQGNGPIDVLWSVKALNLRTGRQVLLDSSGSTPSPVVPVPRAGEGIAVWTDHSNASGADLHVFHLDAGTDTVVRRGVRASNVWVTNGRLVYDDFAATSSVPGAVPPVDVFSEPVAGGPRTRLSRTAVATQPSAGGGYAVWQEPASGDPVRLVTAAVDGRSAPHVVQSGVSAGNAVVDDNAVVFFGVSTVVAVPRTGGPELTLAPVAAVQTRLAASGDEIAWGLTAYGSTTHETTAIFIRRLA